METAEVRSSLAVREWRESEAVEDESTSYAKQGKL